jgi:ribosome-binding factor A
MTLAGKRAVRVGDQILRVIADLLMMKVKDPRARGITLTGIKMSNDLKHGRVYFSVLGDEEDIHRAQAGLDSATGYIKREISARMDLKYMPNLQFKYDPSMEEGRNMERLFEQLKSNPTMEGES